MHIMAEIPDQNVDAAIAALSAFVAPEHIKLFSSVPLQAQAQPKALDDLAKQVVEVISPAAKPPRSREVVPTLPSYQENICTPGEEGEPALRNVVGAILKHN